MRIEINQDYTTGRYKVVMWDGPDGIDHYEDTAKSLGELFEKIIQWRTLNSLCYREA